MCEYCARAEAHPYFAVLLVDSRVHTPVSGYWEYTRHPLSTLQQHNRARRYKKGPKATKGVAPFHRQLMTIGPFWRKEDVFIKALKMRSRKFRARIARCITLAHAWTRLDDPTQRGAPLVVYVADEYDALVRDILRQEGSDADERTTETARELLLSVT